MCTTRVWTRGIPAVGLIVLLSSYGFAAGRASSTSSDNRTTTLHAAPTTAAGEVNLKRATHVMNARVKSTDGTTLGTVHDLVLTPDLNNISYVALSSGGLVGLGSTLHAIPWSAVTMGLNDTLAVPVTKEQLRQTPGFRAAYWPTSADTGWMISNAGTGTRAAYRGQSKEESRVVQDRRFSRIKGFTVRDAQGRNAGKIQDMVIAMDDGRVAYTVVSFGGLLGLGTRYAAVPANAIRLEPDRRMARVNAAPAVLQANSFTPNRWPALSDPAYADQLARAFAVPTGTALGYVPPDASATAPTTRSTAPSTSSTTPSSALTTEPTAADLAGTFNPASISTVEGTVLAAGKLTPAAGGPDLVWLMIRTDDGRTALANLGPRNYISAQDFYVVRGDRIRLTGSAVTTASGRQVWLPTDVTYDNHVLRLRSASGTPLWEGQSTSATTAPGTMTSPVTTVTPSREPSTAGGAATTSDTARESEEPDEL